MRGARRGMALIDALVGGLILAGALSVIISICGQSVARQTTAERQMVAAWLVDELLAMVVAEGPEIYPRVHDTRGRFAEPFADFDYEVIFSNPAEHEPYRVTATVSWPDRGGQVRSVQIETLITQRHEDDEALIIRAPIEPIDRFARYYDDDDDG